MALDWIIDQLRENGMDEEKLGHIREMAMD
jgi:hypothetical protein